MLEEIRQAIHDFIVNTWANVEQDNSSSDEDREIEKYRLSDWEWSNVE